MSTLNDFDRTVGKIAGAIYSDISNQFPHPPLMLVPALTFKVRKIMESVNSLKYLSKQQQGLLAKDIQLSIIPMLSSYEIEESIIEEVLPTIEMAALRAITFAALE